MVLHKHEQASKDIHICIPQLDLATRSLLGYPSETRIVKGFGWASLYVV
jgi:hypothetical protein